MICLFGYSKNTIHTYMKHYHYYFFHRTSNDSMRKGLFHSSCSTAKALLPVENRIIPTGQTTSSEKKKKISLRSSKNKIQWDYNKAIFNRCFKEVQF